MQIPLNYRIILAMDKITKQNADYHAIGFKRWFAWVVLGTISLGMILYVFFMVFVFQIRADIPEYIWSASDAFNIHDYSTINADTDGSFKILQLSDLHFFGGTGKLDRKTYDLAQKLIDFSKPDLVIISGDITFAVDNIAPTRKWINFMESTGVKWAVCFGNHDSTGYADKTKLASMYKAAPNSLFDYGPTNLNDNGKYNTLGNYAINITDSTGSVKSSIILIDSNEFGTDKEEGRYAPISYSTVEWYEWYINGLKDNNGGSILPSLLFFHIPLFECSLAMENINMGQQGFNEKIYGSCKNTGMFSKIKACGSTLATFSGHDHQNFYQSMYQGILLTNNISCGYNTYGDKKLKGGRIIEINVNQSDLALNTYILKASDLV